METKKFNGTPQKPRLIVTKTAGSGLKMDIQIKESEQGSHK
jgi:hypothetical protein